MRSSVLSLPCLALFASVLASPAYAQVTGPFHELDRLMVHWAENNTPPTPPVPGAPPTFKDNGHAGMLALGFTQADVDDLRAECKTYFRDWYDIDFDAPGTIHLPDGTIVGAGAVMFGEYIPPSEDMRVVVDTASRSRNNSENRSYVVKDTGCAMIVLAGGGNYGGINAAMPRTAGDVMVYGYANIFNPQKPLDKAYLVERIKLKPAWPIRIVPAADAFAPAGSPTSTEAVFKVEAEYVDKSGITHYGTGLSTFSQRWDHNGIYYSSRRAVYSFP
ncbi:MAG TPA: hypothetical protein VL263_23265 [Vicinamibacterales bacterium]|nr:hypothetical protein [Vicinamibacterales bacterium]